MRAMEEAWVEQTTAANDLFRAEKFGEALCGYKQALTKAETLNEHIPLCLLPAMNIDVSAELYGFWARNGGSFVLGDAIHGPQPLVDASRQVLKKAIAKISGGVRVSAVGFLIETEAKKRGLKVLRNLVGHGIGRQLHEEPSIANFRDRSDLSRFKKNSVVAGETFIATATTMAVLQYPKTDKWTLVGNKGSFVAQHEHTLLITSGLPQILTHRNGIWD